ncbi:MAG: AMP-binding protein [Pseudonocardiaceae bacterium]
MIEKLSHERPVADSRLQADHRARESLAGGDSMSYRQMADRGAAVATVLAELGVHREERVLILMPDGPGFVEAFVGVMQLGALPLPVSPVLSASLIAEIAADTGARLVVASAERIRALADLEAEPPVLVGGPERPWAAVLRLPR